MPISEARIIQFPKIQDARGNLSFVEGKKHIPFEIKRVYWIYDVPGGSDRGSHAHKNLQQVIIALSGSFDVVINDGFDKKRYHLNISYKGLYLPTRIWRTMDNFSSGSVGVVFASEKYIESDYIRDYSEFNKYINESSSQS